MQPTTLPHRPGSGRVAELWVLPEHDVAAVDRALDGDRLLGSAERQQLARLALPGARRRFRGGRLLARCALTAHTGLPLDGWSFTPGRYGRPEPYPAVGPSVNIAHTDGIVVCVAVRGALAGADVERTPLPQPTAATLVRLLADDEQRWIAGQPASSRGAACAAVWVLKEAYLKATGLGLRRRVAAFGCIPDGAGGAVLRDPELPAAEHGRWRFLLRTRASGHVVAVAVRTAAAGAVPPELTEVSLTGFLALPSAARAPAPHGAALQGAALQGVALQDAALQGAAL